MKSKKIVAMVVALASFMAFATSGFAAVTTTTTYNTVDGKVAIDVDVTATAGKEVTYLVKNKKGDIVYIDQDTAESGTAEFTYKIPQEKFIDENGNVDLTTTVQLGTDGEALDANGKDIILNQVQIVKDEHATVTFYNNANGTGDPISGILGTTADDVVYAEVTAAADYEISSVKVNNVEVYNSTTKANVFEIKGTDADKKIEVATKKTVIDPGATKVDIPEIEAKKETTYTDPETQAQIEVTELTTLIAVVGTPSQVGVEYNGKKYPALASYDGTSGGYEVFKTEGQQCAVRIITKRGEATEVNTYFE